jgi:hypothetical protein
MVGKQNHLQLAYLTGDELLVESKAKDEEKLQQVMKENLLKREIYQAHPHLLTQKIQKYRQNSYLNPEQ